MRYGPNRRIIDWRRIRVHSAGRYGHEAPVGRLGARQSVTEHARFRRTALTGANMARITRRTILKLSGAGALAARTGGLAAILATGRGPAFAQAKSLHWLRWVDF